MSEQVKTFPSLSLKHARSLFQLAYPVSIGQLSHMLTNISDTIMLGKFDPAHLAASTFSFSVFIPLLVFSTGFTMGLTPLVTHQKAKNNKNELKQLNSNGFATFGMLSLIMYAVGFTLSSLLDQMGQTAEIVQLSTPYFNLLCFSMIPIILAALFKQFTEGLSRTKEVMTISIISNLLNIFLNYLLIYGHWGFAAMGIIGAGYATLIARFSLLALSIIVMFRTPLFKSLMWVKVWTKCSWKGIKEIIEISFPIAFQYSLEVSAFALSAIIIGWLPNPEESLSAHQIGISIAALTYLIASGLGAAATIKVGESIGKNEPLNVKKNTYTSLAMVLLFMGTMAVVIFIVKNQLPLFFVNPSETNIIRMAASLLAICTLFQLSDGIQVVCHGILRGMKDVQIPTVVSLLSYWGLGLPSSYYFGITLEMGVAGVWYGYIVSLTTMSLLLFLRVKNRLSAL